MDPYSWLLSSPPDTTDVVRARARRATGVGTPDDVTMDRYGTGQEMGVLAVPVTAAYEAAKPLLRASPALNSLLGAIAGPEQMVGPNTQVPTLGQAAGNVGAAALGAASQMPGVDALRAALLRAFRGAQ